MPSCESRRTTRAKNSKTVYEDTKDRIPAATARAVNLRAQFNRT